MSPSRRLLAFTTGAVLLAGVTVRAAEDASPVNILAGDDVAIHGYDPVAYFVDGGPRKGLPELSVQMDGARWLFSSVANKERFEESPARYQPVYGGYCAFGVAQGYLVKIDPEAWSVVDDRLYLNYDLNVRSEWLKDVPGHLAKADANWPRLVGRP